MSKKLNTPTPMMQQYLQTKSECQDCILFYRLGDFYEMFFEDAKIASRELEITLTGKDCGLDERAPMCGVPYHSANSYISKLIDRGYKVAICEQVEDPKQAKGIVKRDVVRIVTPGTVTEDDFLDQKTNNYLEVIYCGSDESALVFCDISTGELYALSVASQTGIINETARYNPREIIINSGAGTELCKKITLQSGIIPDISHDELFSESATALNHFPQYREILDKTPIICTAISAMLQYLFRTQKSSVDYINTLNIYSVSDFMEIDMSTRRNLEITSSLRDGNRKGSLLGVLDNTCTSMGARLLRKWAQLPLINIYQIQDRLDAVEELTNNFDMRQSSKYILSSTYDVSRIITRASNGSITPRDMLALKETLNNLPSLKIMLNNAKSSLIRGIHIDFDAMNKLWIFLESAIANDAPANIRDGGIIKNGHDKQVDTLRDIQKNAKAYLEAFAEEERKRTGISKLKIGYNKVFGYYIDITKSQANNAPQDYIRRQTLSNNERFTTPKLKEIENEIMNASEKLSALENYLYGKAIEQIMKYYDSLKALAEGLALLDCLRSLAQAAVKNNYTRPFVDNSGLIEIIEGRHPVVETYAKDSIFVPNDTTLDTDKNRMMIITGPNMAGKSTYMRQTALITLMAQMGSFVPANSAHIGIVDKIFTRVGASDDIASGQSTFMVEMNEVANILNNATKRSLVILDEIGRGTSTFDGLSIAWAVAEYMLDPKKIGAKTLFATHYHEMSEMEDNHTGVKNYRVCVNKKGDEIVFLRKIVRGSADRSYGIEVAALAGVPKPVISAAKRILKHLEQTSPKRDEPVFDQLELFMDEDYSEIDYKVDDTYTPPALIPNPAADEIFNELKNLDVPSMTIMDAAQKLFALSDKAKSAQTKKG